MDDAPGAADGLPRRRARRRQDLRDARRGAPPAASAAPTSSSGTSRRTAASRPTAQLDGLEVVPRRGGRLPRHDVHRDGHRRGARPAAGGRAASTSSRTPTCPAAGTRSGPRTSSELRAAGIDVITTVNIQHLESLNDEVERITGVRQRETVPDEVVRTADQIQLVDMSPDALRRRMAHGNIYRPEQVDASLTSYFRVGNLTALRELALLWLADRVDDQLDDYRRAHRIQETWPAKERIVVAVTGGAGERDADPARRPARPARGRARSCSPCTSSPPTGCANPDERRIARAQQLVASLGGTFHSVVGEDVSAAVVDFAAGANATMIVVGVSRHGRLRRLFTGTTGDRIASLAGSIDVHLVTHDQVARRGPVAAAALAAVAGAPGRRLGRRRGAADAADAGAARLRTTPTSCRWRCSPCSPPPCVVALVGGLLPALRGRGRSASCTLNYFFTPPVAHASRSPSPRNVARPGGLRRPSRRRSPPWSTAPRGGRPTPLRARTEAATMGALSRSVLTGQDTAEAIVERLRETFGQDAVSLLERGPGRLDGRWPSSGAPAPSTPDEGDTRVQVDDDHVLALCGAPLRATDQRVLEAFAVQTGLVLEYRRLREREERAADAGARRGDPHRAAAGGLPRPADAAGHHARLGRRAAGLGRLGRATGAELVARRRRLRRAAGAADRQPARPVPAAERAGAPGAARPQPRGGAAAGGRRPAAGRRDASRSTSPRRWSPPTPACSSGWSPTWSPTPSGSRAGTPVRVLAHVLPGDRRGASSSTAAPACRPRQRERMFEPFQRLGDTSAGGLGLGLAVARGLTEALGGTPVRRGHPRRRADHGAVAPPGRRPATEARAAVVSPGKVLVVDDEPALARALAINLRAHGWEVVTAADGRSALDAAATDPPRRRRARPRPARTWTAPR